MEVETVEPEHNNIFEALARKVQEIKHDSISNLILWYSTVHHDMFVSLLQYRGTVLHWIVLYAVRLSVLEYQAPFPSCTVAVVVHALSTLTFSL